MTPAAALDTKRCPSCGETKPLDEFYPRARGGVEWQCKTCSSNRANKWNKTHRERATRNVQALRARDAEVRKRDRLQVAAYRAAEQRLREAHRDEFNGYYQDERRKRGLS